MRTILALLIVLVASLLALWMFEARDEAAREAASLRVENGPHSDGPHATLAVPRDRGESARGSKFEPASTIDSARPRTDATGNLPWVLRVKVRGVSAPVSEPLLLRAAPLGEPDRFLLLPLDGNGEYEFDLAGVNQEQLFDSPGLNLTLDHPDYFLWDELLDGTRVETEEVQAMMVCFEAEIEVEPLRASLAGRVLSPAGYAEPIFVAVFAMDPVKDFPEPKPIIVQACAADGSFRLEVEDPNDCIVAGYSKGLIPGCVRLDAPPGTVRNDLLIYLEEGRSISGWASLDGQPLKESSIVRALGTTTRQTLELGGIWFGFDETETRFLTEGVTGVVGRGGFFTLRGLAEGLYDLHLHESVEGDRVRVYSPYRSDGHEAGRFKAPAQGIRIALRSVQVSVELQRGGKLLDWSIFVHDGSNEFAPEVTRNELGRYALKAGRQSRIIAMDDEGNEHEFFIDAADAEGRGALVIDVPN